MPELTVITFKFAQPRRWKQLRYDLYTAEHVNALYRACARNIGIPHNFVCFTDDPEGIDCETRDVPEPVRVKGEDGCYRRLKSFDPEFQEALGTEFILMLDLDLVFQDDATEIIRQGMQNDLTMMKGSVWGRDGTLCSFYNGGMWLCRTGTHPELWADFNPDTFYDEREAFKMPGSGRRPHGTDQAWYSVRLEDSIPWFEPSKVVQYRETKNFGTDAPMVFFAGQEKPWSAAVQQQNSRIHALWACYALDKVSAAHQGQGRCLILGNQDSVWTDVANAIAEGPYDGVIASPEAALQWPRKVDGLALGAPQAIRMAQNMGFKEIALCGFLNAPRETAETKLSRSA